MKDFANERDEMVQNSVKTERFGSKKSFKLYRQILLKVLTKFGINFADFASTKVSKIKPTVNVVLKKPFFLPTI
jgi:hypothetical protein